MIGLGLENKTVIVTGAARGIGQHYCLGFAQAGANVVAADIMDVEDTLQKIAATGSKAQGVRVDVTSFSSCAQMVDKTVQQFGHVDVLVNNAALYGGLKGYGSFMDIAEDEWDQVMQRQRGMELRQSRSASDGQSSIRKNSQHFFGNHLDGYPRDLTLCNVKRRNICYDAISVQGAWSTWYPRQHLSPRAYHVPGVTRFASRCRYGGCHHPAAGESGGIGQRRAARRLGRYGAVSRFPFKRFYDRTNGERRWWSYQLVIYFALWVKRHSYS